MKKIRNRNTAYPMFTPQKKNPHKPLIYKGIISAIVTSKGFEPLSSEPKSDILIH